MNTIIGIYGFVIVVFGVFKLWHIVFSLLGLLLYKLRLKKAGHYFRAMATADNTVNPEWLVDNCPYECTKCDSCVRWTCPNYRKKEKEKENER